MFHGIFAAVGGLFFMFFCMFLGLLGWTILFILAMLWVGRQVNIWERAGKPRSY